MESKKNKSAVTPSNVPQSAPSKQGRKKRGKKGGGKNKTPGKNPQNRQEAKFEEKLASAVGWVKTGQPPTAFNYNEMNKSQKFALGMVDPIHFPSRVPDADSNASAMFRSYETFEIPVRTGPSLTNSGAFSIAIQPKIGDSSAINRFKVAIAKSDLISNNPQNTDWSSPNSFQTKLGSLDPRMVNEIDTLALNEAGFWQFLAGGTLSAGQPLGTAPVPGPGSGFLEVDYDATNGDIILPVGQYQVTSQVLSTGGNITALTLNAGVVGGAPDIDLLTTTSGLGTTNSQRAYIVSTTPGRTHINLTSTLSAGSVTASAMTIVPVAKSDIPQALTNGMIEKVRPTGCCYWLTYTGTTLKNGGRVTTAVVNGDSLSSRFFSEGSGGNNGNFRSFEGVGMVPGALDDKLKTGCYGFIKPNNVLDTAYFPVDEHNDYKYNAGVIYGQFQPDDGATVDQTTSPIRLIVCTVYEYQTTSQVPELAINKGSESQVSAALNFLSAMPQVMTNDEHVGFWDRVKSALSSVGHGIKGALDKGSSFLKTLQSYEPAAQEMLKTLMPLLA